MNVALDRTRHQASTPDEYLSEPDLTPASDLLLLLTKRLAGMPFDPVADKLIRAAQAAAERSESQLARLDERLAQVERLAVTDELTGILNRRGFETELRRTVDAARRYGEEGVLIYVDLDGFKPVNDGFGHAAGDAVLRRVARMLEEHTRATDIVGRLGGDEFGVLLTRTGRAGGLKSAELLDRAINGASVPYQGRSIAIRASFGFQPFDGETDAAGLLAGADSAMYECKRVRSGRGGATRILPEML